MKTFKDLEFKERDNFIAFQAKMKFDNGYELSVVAGKGAYCSPRENLASIDEYDSFELGVFGPDGEFVTQDFLPGIDDQVVGWQNRGQINALMLLIQSKK